MKNVTISMDDALYRATRIKAAEAQKSVSRYIADLLKADLDGSSLSRPAQSREEQIAALERILSGPKWSIMQNGRMPSAEERNER